MATDLLTQVRVEIEGRLAELRPAVAEYERLLGASDALGASGEVAGAANGSGPTQRARRVIRASGAKAGAVSTTKAGVAPKRRQSRMGPVEQAILAALEHGSHTLGELGIVTALPASALRDGARTLLGAGKITRASREGKAAYALSGSA